MTLTHSQLPKIITQKSMKLKSLSIILIFVYFSPIITHADVLTPPKLGDVIKKNEQFQRIQQIQKNKLRNRIWSWIILPSQEIFAYHTLEKGNAITLTKYDTLDVWVQEIKLDKWWRLESNLVLGGYEKLNWEPLFEKKKLSEVHATISNAFSIINGQFFDPKKSITPLSFWIKVDGIVRTAGADNRNESKNILIIENKKAKIIPYSWENLRDAPGYFAMVNLSLGTSHYRDESIGRTYICLKNPNTQNESSTILIFTAISITEPVIENELIRWWCTRNSVSKLDSSGSTQLWINGQTIFGYTHDGNPDRRKIPHSIVIYDGKI